MTNEEFIKSVSLEGEIWKDVVGYEGRYAVSNLGRVASLSRLENHNYGGKKLIKPQILKQRTAKNGYKTISIRKNGILNLYLVHRLVALAFIPNPENKPCVDHINRDRTFNQVDNLRWVTHSENMLNPLSYPLYQKINLGRKRPYAYHPVVALKDDKVIYKFDKLTDCIECGFDYTSVSSICAGRRKRHKGFTFMYLSDYESLINMSKNDLPNPN